MAIDTARELALKILYDINEKGAYSNIAINKHLESNEVRDMDKALITEIVYGSVKWRLSIDWIIEQFSSIKIRKLSPWILNILRMGIYQILFTDKIPESAACNESVKLAKRYGHAASSGYVNAILRNVVRKKESVNYPDPQKDFLQYLTVKYSHPHWMVKKWLDRYGGEFTEALLAVNNSVPDFTIRVNTLKTSKTELISKLQNNGFRTADGKYADEAIIVENPGSIINTEEFKKGLFQVQDESSMLVGRVLDPKAGEFVIDVCSAPGGKATHIAQIMGNNGVVLARDIHEHKIRLINDAAARLGTSIVKSEVFDAAKLDERYTGKADRVLVDAPCTGLGILRRKPDIKWARNESETGEITKLQREILSTAAKYVKPGGYLVYSTCTIEPEENELMVSDFAASDEDFTLTDISGVLPENIKKPEAGKGYIQIYPNIDGIDGFFIAKLQRRG